MKVVVKFILFSVLGGMQAPLLAEADSPRHIEVLREAGRFGGWPANHGIWSWGDEIVVGFELGYFHFNEEGEHAIDYSRPAEHLLARSLDGGETWSIERPEGLRPPEGELIAGVPTGEGGKAPVDSPGGIPFDHPDFAFSARMASFHIGPSRFYYSTDRGKNWLGPYKISDFGTPGIAARTDYLVDGPEVMTMFLTAAKANRREGRVICVRSEDGGKSWDLIGKLGEEPEGRDYAIMPSSVRLSKSEILTAIRHRNFIELYRSQDNGVSWTLEGAPATEMGGNPPSLIKLEDGRLVLTYGYRKDPYGIRARLSRDRGATWSEEAVLRSDGGNWDLGYPRTVQRSDGKLVTVYYFNLDSNEERFIAATIWDPDQLFID